MKSIDNQQVFDRFHTNSYVVIYMTQNITASLMAAGAVLIYNIIEAQYRINKQATPRPLFWVLLALSIINYVAVNVFTALAVCEGRQLWYVFVLVYMIVSFMVLLGVADVSAWSVREMVLKFQARAASALGRQARAAERGLYPLYAFLIFLNLLLGAVIGALLYQSIHIVLTDQTNEPPDRADPTSWSIDTFAWVHSVAILVFLWWSWVPLHVLRPIARRLGYQLEADLVQEVGRERAATMPASPPGPRATTFRGASMLSLARGKLMRPIDANRARKGTISSNVVSGAGGDATPVGVPRAGLRASGQTVAPSSATVISSPPSVVVVEAFVQPASAGGGNPALAPLARRPAFSVSSSVVGGAGAGGGGGALTVPVSPLGPVSTGRGPSPLPLYDRADDDVAELSVSEGDDRQGLLARLRHGSTARRSSTSPAAIHPLPTGSSSAHASAAPSPSNKGASHREQMNTFLRVPSPRSLNRTPAASDGTGVEPLDETTLDLMTSASPTPGPASPSVRVPHVALHLLPLPLPPPATSALIMPQSNR